jgi:hypothetical protein
LIIAQLFNIKINDIDEIQDINEDLNNLYKIKQNLLIKLNSKFIDETIKPIDEIQNEIVSVEEEVIIEPKPKTKIIIKKKVKKPLVIVEEDNEV